MSDVYTGRDEGDSIATIQHAADIGISFFDTSDFYSPHTNEELLGRMTKGQRSEVLLATKFGILRDPKALSVRGFDSATYRNSTRRPPKQYISQQRNCRHIDRPCGPARNSAQAGELKRSTTASRFTDRKLRGRFLRRR